MKCFTLLRRAVRDGAHHVAPSNKDILHRSDAAAAAAFNSHCSVGHGHRHSIGGKKHVEGRAACLPRSNSCSRGAEKKKSKCKGGTERKWRENKERHGECHCNFRPCLSLCLCRPDAGQECEFELPPPPHLPAMKEEKSKRRREGEDKSASFR